MRFSLAMKTVFLALMILATANGMAAKPLTFSFEEYQVDPTKMSDDGNSPIETLGDIEPTVSLAFLLSAEGNGKASASIAGSNVTVEVQAVTNKDSSYRISVNHEFMSGYDGDVPIMSTRGTEAEVSLEGGDHKLISIMEERKGKGLEQSSRTYALFVKLSD